MAVPLQPKASCPHSAQQVHATQLVDEAQQSGWGELHRLLWRHSVAVLLWNSVRLTVACTLLCALLGVGGAWLLERADLPLRRLWAVLLVLPLLLQPHWFYLLVAETFAPVAECWLFWMAFIRDRPLDRRATLRDLVVITLANLASFGSGELLHWLDWWPRWTGIQPQ